MVKRTRHPCQRWCEGQLQGIVTSLKIREEIESNSVFEFSPVRGFSVIPKDSYVLRCQHGRQWLVRDVTPEPAR